MSLVIKGNYIDATDHLLKYDYLDYFEKERFDKGIFTCDLSIKFHPVISEAISKIQKEKAKRSK